MTIICWKPRCQFHKHFTSIFLVQKLFWASFLYLQFGFIFFCQKNFGKKAVHKMLVILTKKWYVSWSMELNLEFKKKIKILPWENDFCTPMKSKSRKIFENIFLFLMMTSFFASSSWKENKEKTFLTFDFYLPRHKILLKLLKEQILK